jgi:hypothetical protein
MAASENVERLDPLERLDAHNEVVNAGAKVSTPGAEWG